LLRIDLLPEHFAQARAARAWLVFMVVLLLVVVAANFLFLTMKKSQLAAVKADLAKWDAEARQVEAIETEVANLKALAAPIDSKVNFIEQADSSGEQYWAAFDKVNRYIYAKARMLQFSITPPSTVSFQVEVPDTTSVGRFVLNLIRCPDITNTNFGGTIPSGPGVGGAAGAAAPAGGGAGAGPPMGMGMGSMGGGAPGGMMGMPGMGGGAPGGGAAAGASGPIILTVSAQLTSPITVPQPGGGAPAAAAGGAAGGGMGSMMGGGGGMGSMMGGSMGGGKMGGGMAGPPPGGPGGAGGAPGSSEKGKGSGAAPSAGESKAERAAGGDE
jgi:hypothetical protein